MIRIPSSIPAIMYVSPDPTAVNPRIFEIQLLVHHLRLLTFIYLNPIPALLVRAPAAVFELALIAGTRRLQFSPEHAELQWKLVITYMRITYILGITYEIRGPCTRSML